MIDYTQLRANLDKEFPLLPPHIMDIIIDVVGKEEQKDIDIQVKHPAHYTSHPSGVECIEVASQFDFCLGNAIKYRWRSGLKDGQPPEKDNAKASYYLELRKKYYSSEELNVGDVDALIENHIKYIPKQRKENNDRK